MKAVPRNRRQVYKMRPIIDAVVDKGSFFEVNANFGRPVITGLARLEGRAVLLLASDPFHYGGSWTAEACQKVVRWVDFAETFHLPVVYLMDCPGFMIGLEAEKSATIRHGVRAMAAVNQSTVPWCTIIVRNAFGVAGVVHQPANRYSMRYAWPSAYWGSLPLEGGIEAAYRADIDAADDPALKLKEIEERLNKLRSPFRSAEKFWVEEVIDPRKTRSLLCEFARLAEPIRNDGAGNEHGDHGREDASSEDGEVSVPTILPRRWWARRIRLYSPYFAHATTGFGREIASTISAATMQSAPATKKAGR